MNVETDFGAEGGDGERGFVGESEAFGEGGEEGVRGGRGAVVVDDHWIGCHGDGRWPINIANRNGSCGGRVTMRRGLNRVSLISIKKY